MVREDVTLGDLQVFAERGGESVVADRDGNVYVANGQIFVYRPTGELGAGSTYPSGRPDSASVDVTGGRSSY